MPIKKVLIAIILTIGLWFSSEEVRSQSPTSEAARPVEPDTTKKGADESDRKKELARIAGELAQLTQAQAQAKGADAPELDRLKAQLELQQKEIDVLLRMTQMLAGKVEEQPATAPAVEKLQEQVAVQDARIQQGAERDQALARSHDEMMERIEAEDRSRSQLPANLRELFLPFRTNESPLSIYGLISQDFNTFSKQNSTFRPPTVQIHPYLLLNERWMFSANLIFLSSSLQICRMQADYFINDSLTFVAGRFYSPIGFYSERIRLDWVQKTPDAPLMFNQVYPQNLFFDGLQLRGARYLFDSPVKLEYVGFVANGLSLQGNDSSPRTYSDLSNFSDSINDGETKQGRGEAGSAYRFPSTASSAAFPACRTSPTTRAGTL